MGDIFYIAIVLALIYYFVIVRNGNLGFWKKAAKYPEFVCGQLLKDEDSWLMDDGVTKVDKKKFDGPFLLFVPSLGKTIKFYGKVGKYEESQKRIEATLKDMKEDHR